MTVELRGSAVQFSFDGLETGNPNKMPFKGVLTYLDAASDKPPGGSGGRKVLIPSSVGIPALDSLKGMGVNLAAEADEHEVTHKIGVITDAYTGNLTAKGLEVIVEGHIFARDFPREASMIKLNQSSLGFSYETANTLLASQEINGEDVAVAQSLVFTGAAILLKKAAAYQSTSIAASANPKGEPSEVTITADELKALLGELKTDILASVDSKLDGVKEELKASAAHVVEAPVVETPATEVTASAEVNVDDIVAKAVAAALAAQKPAETTVQASATETPKAPERRSFAAGTLLAKYDVNSEGETDLIASIDRTAEKAGVGLTDRIAMKMEAWREQQAK